MTAQDRQLKELLKSRGLYASKNRLLLLGTLNQKDYKPTLVELCKDLYEQYDLAHITIYPGIKDFIKVGLVRPVGRLAPLRLDGYQVPHHNLICKACGNIESIDHQELDGYSIYAAVRKLGFHLRGQGLDIEVICPKCLGKPLVPRSAMTQEKSS